MNDRFSEEGISMVLLCWFEIYCEQELRRYW